jgi:hypothetical protein
MANLDDFDTSESQLALAKSLVTMVWGTGEIPATFDVKYEGADWEVIVRIKQTEDAPFFGDGDFTEKLPE